MANFTYAKIYYQQDEEVLQSGVWYKNDTAGPSIDATAHQAFAFDIWTDLSLNIDIFPSQWKLFAVEVTAPKTEALPYGPHRYCYTKTAQSAAVVSSVGDLGAVIVKFNGFNDDQEPITGGMRLSCVPIDQVDCNTLTQGFVTQMETFINACFPETRQPSDGTEWTRQIKSSTGGGGAGGFYVSTGFSINPLIGTRIDRVLNRTQGKGEPIVV